ncbi:MAG: precorrin-2 C(20)-methyltransferase [Synergistaceae bacterium]|nr:precorrin-2 C(20)-methyltransferase [Synergistaceae bacterium]
MILYGVGVGPGDPDLITIAARRALDDADVVFVPISASDHRSIAGDIYSQLGCGKRAYPFLFPMTNDADVRDGEILRQIGGYESLWRNAGKVALPVIGDSALFATAAHLYRVWRGVCPDLQLKLLPGVSAHSLASSIVNEFLVIGTERMAILPGGRGYASLAEAMKTSECVALYKPSAVGAELPKLVESTGPWGKAVRVHRAGLPGQTVVCGDEACSPTDDYLSILLLWRERA